MCIPKYFPLLNLNLSWYKKEIPMYIIIKNFLWELFIYPFVKCMQLHQFNFINLIFYYLLTHLSIITSDYFSKNYRDNPIIQICLTTFILIMLNCFSEYKVFRNNNQRDYYFQIQLNFKNLCNLISMFLKYLFYLF